MRQGALRRAVGAGVVIAGAAIILGNGVVGSTSASFVGETKNAGSAFAGGWIGAPSAGSATASGYDMKLAWTPGTAGPVTGQQLKGVDNGTSSNCTGAAYASLTTLASAGTASYTDANRGNAANNGDWYCYELVSTSATVWTSLFDLPAAQLGLAATGVSIANGAGGTANTIEGGDTITLTFNQRTTIPNGSVKVCVFNTNKTILIDDQKSGNNCGSVTGDGYNIGALTTTSTITGASRFTNSSVSVSTTAPWTVTITLGSGGSSTVTAGATWSFTPAAGVLSFATTDQAAACTTTATTCQPTSATSF
jgi:hypothetical protein